jgi:hypothetical protein
MNVDVHPACLIVGRFSPAIQFELAVKVIGSFDIPLVCVQFRMAKFLQMSRLGSNK